MKPAVLVLTLAVVAAEPALALSCLRPNIARTFNRVAEAEAVYVMALGRLVQTGPAVDRTPVSETPPPPGVEPSPDETLGIPQEVPALFTGGFFGPDGLSADRTVDVAVDVTCLASWCGSYPESAAPILVFLEQNDGGYRLESGPCEGNFKLAPTDLELSVLTSCLNAGTCTDAQIASLDPH